MDLQFFELLLMGMMAVFSAGCAWAVLQSKVGNHDKRITKLEDKSSERDKEFTDIKTDLAEIKTDLKHVLRELKLNGYNKE